MSRSQAVPLDELEGLQEAALAYADRGWRVLQVHHLMDGRCTCGKPDCASPGKHPRIYDWGTLATTDKRTIRKWWKEEPRAHVGIATGEETGLLVIDIDPRNGGEDTWESIKDELGVTETFDVWTGGGGLHCYFRFPAGRNITTGAGSIGPGVDHRGNGGMVLAPPSGHKSGQQYHWDIVGGDEIPECPDALADKLAKPDRTLSDQPVSLELNPPWWAILRRLGFRVDEIDRIGQNLGDPIARHVPGLYAPDAGSKVPAAIISGGRHDTCVGIIGHLRRGGLSERAIDCALRHLCETRMRPPWDAAEMESELEGMIRSSDGWVADRVRWPAPDPKGVADAVLGMGTISAVAEDEGIKRAMLRLPDHGWAILEQRLQDGGMKRKGVNTVKAISRFGREREQQQDHPAGLPADGGGEAPAKTDGFGGKGLDKFRWPVGWQQDNDGRLCREVDRVRADGGRETELHVVAASPVLITRREVDVASGDYHVMLTWRDIQTKRWREARAQRAACMSARKVPDLAAKDIPATSGNAKSLVDWFSEFEQANAQAIPVQKISQTIGWHHGEEGITGYLYGATWIGGLSAVELDSEGGIAQIANAMDPRGDAEVEHETLAKVAEFPSVLAVIGASLAAPILRVVECRGFTLSLSGETSTGKTSAMRCGAAIWGEPDESEAASVLQTWNCTRVWIERVRGALDGVPLMLDDTQVASSMDMVGQVLYDVPSGRGRGRGTANAGTRATEGNRAVLVSSGETPILETSQQGGTRARVLELWGAPWGGASQDTADIIRETLWRLSEHHGNTGLAWVGYLLRHRKKWPAWRDRYRKRARELTQRLTHPDSPQAGAVVARLADYIGAIDAALKLAKAAGILSVTDDQIEMVAHVLTRNAVGEAVSKDAPSEAMQRVIDVAVARRADLWALGKEYDDRAPTRGWLGRWDGKGRSLMLFQDQLHAILRDGRWSPGGVMRVWAERNWIRASGTRMTKTARVAGSTARVVEIPAEALVAVLGYDPSDTDDDVTGPQDAP